MFQRLLVANRGEIACRVIETARKLNIHVIAIYSEVDEHAKHVQLADEAYYVGLASPLKSYLNISNILTIAKKTRVDAIHPGYGFLSENAEFAIACLKNQITFIGPTSDAIRKMGSKIESKIIMQRASIPVIPGYYGVEQSFKILKKAALKIGFPLLIKASGGGGGKGMRLVETSKTFELALASCRREALTAFGNNQVILEKYLINSRHIEVQIVADNKGNVIHLFERDCSIQRRHQKIIEEAPANKLPQAVRIKMRETAIKVALTIGYRGAGTIEFLYEAPDLFYFMEMNTRLQVEHPVTEMITGLDLVEWQIRIAANESILIKQGEITSSGYAIETRIYGEDPNCNFLPATGEITSLLLPSVKKNVRFDTGIQIKDKISIHYDPLLGKLITWGETREIAIIQMQEALSQLHIVGINTNVAFLRKVLKHATFLKGTMQTTFIDKYEELLQNYPEDFNFALLGATLFQKSALCSFKHMSKNVEFNSPWNQDSNWRLNYSLAEKITWLYKNEAYIVFILNVQKTCTIQINQIQWHIYNLKVNYKTARLCFSANDKYVSVSFIQLEQGIYISLENQDFYFLFHSLATFTFHNHTAGTLIAPMPGIISKIFIELGNQVEINEALLSLEAMKMEHTIKAPFSGKVVELFYGTGDAVEEGVALIAINPSNENIDHEFT